MPKHALIDEVNHRELRVRRGYGAEYGDDLMCVPAIPSEFRELVADYPIFIHRDEQDGRYLPWAMFGFEAGENLFLAGSEWQADYVPLLVRRGPFLIGLRQSEASMAGERAKMLSIDLEHPRVEPKGGEGEPLFTPFGDHSEYTEGIIRVLRQIDQGQPVVAEWMTALAERELMEPFSLQVTLDNRETRTLHGFHTVSEERLTALPAEVMADFARRGILHGAYMIIASMANVPRLVRLKNQRDKAAAGTPAP